MGMHNPLLQPPSFHRRRTRVTGLNILFSLMTSTRTYLAYPAQQDLVYLDKSLKS